MKSKLLSNNTFKYFLYSLKKSIKPFIYILLIGILIYPVAVISTNYDDNYFRLSSPQVAMAIVFVGVLCFIVPIFKASYLMNTKTINCFYSLPIKKRTLQNVHWLIGLLLIIIPFTIIYVLGLGITAIKTDRFNYYFYFPMYWWIILTLIPLYTFNYFIFTRGNTVVDGILFMFLYTFVFALFVAMITINFENQNIPTPLLSDNFTYFFTFSPFTVVYNYYIEFIKYGSTENLVMFYPSIIFLVVLGVVSFVLLNVFPNIDKPENAGQISHSWFGYRVLIPLYYLLLSLIEINFISTSFYIIHIILLIAALVGYVIYYRKFKLPLKSIIVLGSLILLNIIMYIVK